MYIHRIKKGTYLLSGSYRDGSRVRKRTYANISGWPVERATALAEACDQSHSGRLAVASLILQLLSEQETFALKVISRKGKGESKYLLAEQSLLWEMSVLLRRTYYGRRLMG